MWETNFLDSMKAYEERMYHPEAEALIIKKYRRYLNAGWKQEMVVMKLLLLMVKNCMYSSESNVFIGEVSSLEPGWLLATLYRLNYIVSGEGCNCRFSFKKGN